MEIPFIIIFLGLLIIAAHVFNFLFQFIKLPTALLLILIGIIIGPALGIVNTGHFGKVGPVFTSLTLIVILFNSGVNLRLSELGSVFGRSLAFSLLNFLITTLIAALVVYLANGMSNILASLFLGSIVGGTSSAVVIPMIRQIKPGKDTFTMLTLESALTDVLCLIIGLALLAAMQLGTLDSGQLFSRIGSSFLMAILLGTGCGMVWTLLLQKIRKIQNSNFINLAIAIVIAGVADILEWNSGIAALSFGIAIANIPLIRKYKIGKYFPATELSSTEMNFFDEIAFVLQTYFFVYVGVAMKFGNLWISLSGFIVTALILITRPWSVKLIAKKRTPLKDLVAMTIMMPKGMVPAILASLPLQLGLAGGALLEGIAFSIVFASILVCSILIMFLSKNPGRILYFKKILFKKSEEFALEAQPVEIKVGAPVTQGNSSGPSSGEPADDQNAG